MSYATQQDLTDHLGINGAVQLAQITDPAGVMIDGAMVALYLAKADHEVNAYLGMMMSIPLTSPYPPLPIPAGTTAIIIPQTYAVAYNTDAMTIRYGQHGLVNYTKLGWPIPQHWPWVA